MYFWRSGGPGTIDLLAVLPESVSLRFTGEDEEMPQCMRRCTDALANDDLDERRSTRELMACGASSTCEELVDCEARRSPEAACAAHCEAVRDCGDGSPECFLDCVGDFYLTRNQAWRACVAEQHDDCADIDECEPPAPFNCQAICDRLNACGVNQPRCMERCAENGYLHGEVYRHYAACVLSAPLCVNMPLSVEQCDRDRSRGGRPCAKFCWQRVGCDPSRFDEYSDCVQTCGVGFQGEEQALFESSAECLAGVSHLAECDVLAACIPLAPQPPCEVWCAALESCQNAPLDCLEDCRDGGLAAVDAMRYGRCVVVEGGDCPAVETCWAGRALTAPRRG